MKRVWERWKGYVADEGAFNMYRAVGEYVQERNQSYQARNIAVNVFSCKNDSVEKP